MICRKAFYRSQRRNSPTFSLSCFSSSETLSTGVMSPTIDSPKSWIKPIFMQLRLIDSSNAVLHLVHKRVFDKERHHRLQRNRKSSFVRLARSGRRSTRGPSRFGRSSPFALSSSVTPNGRPHLQIVAQVEEVAQHRRVHEKLSPFSADRKGRSFSSTFLEWSRRLYTPSSRRHV